MRQRLEGTCVRLQRNGSEFVDRGEAAFRRPAHSKQCDFSDLGQTNVALILPSIGQETNAEEAEYHHCPSGRLRNGRTKCRRDVSSKGCPATIIVTDVQGKEDIRRSHTDYVAIVDLRLQVGG